MTLKSCWIGTCYTFPNDFSIGYCGCFSEIAAAAADPQAWPGMAQHGNSQQVLRL